MVCSKQAVDSVPISLRFFSFVVSWPLYFFVSAIDIERETQCGIYLIDLMTQRFFSLDI